MKSRSIGALLAFAAAAPAVLVLGVAAADVDRLEGAGEASKGATEALPLLALAAVFCIGPVRGASPMAPDAVGMVAAGGGASNSSSNARDEVSGGCAISMFGGAATGAGGGSAATISNSSCGKGRKDSSDERVIGASERSGSSDSCVSGAAGIGDVAKVSSGADALEVETGLALVAVAAAGGVATATAALAGATGRGGALAAGGGAAAGAGRAGGTMGAADFEVGFEEVVARVAVTAGAGVRLAAALGVFGAAVLPAAVDAAFAAAGGLTVGAGAAEAAAERAGLGANVGRDAVLGCPAGVALLFEVADELAAAFAGRDTDSEGSGFAVVARDAVVFAGAAELAVLLGAGRAPESVFGSGVDADWVEAALDDGCDAGLETSLGPGRDPDSAAPDLDAPPAVLAGAAESAVAADCVGVPGCAGVAGCAEAVGVGMSAASSESSSSSRPSRSSGSRIAADPAGGVSGTF